jgi:hypothetical protein
VASGLERAVAEADRLIHDNDVERLKQLLADCPALLSRKGNDCRKFGQQGDHVDQDATSEASR